MSAQIPFPSGSSRSTYGSAKFLVGGLAAALTILAIFTGLEVPVAAARSDVELSGQTVNRTLKGDRLLLVPAFHRNAVNGPIETKAPRGSASHSKLPDGCEPLVSSLANSQLARIAGRCVS